MGLPSPPADDHSHPRKNTSTHTSSKPNKISRCGSQRKTNKRPPGAASPHPHDHSVDGRHKRVWKACERCRMKKTKCDGEVPCKRCQDDGQICITKVRKKLEYKQLPRGYAEVLENTQFTLIATIHKLYSMVREGQEWDLEEPEMNERGQPVIHDIAQKLGCIRPNSDIDLPVHSVFPEDEAGMQELAQQLEEQQQHESDSQQQQEQEQEQEQQHQHQHQHQHQQHQQQQSQLHQESRGVVSPKFERDSSSELDISDLDQFQDYRKMAFGMENDSVPNLSPAQSYSMPELNIPPPQLVAGFPSPLSPSMPDFTTSNTQVRDFMSQVYGKLDTLPLGVDGSNQGLPLPSYQYDMMFKGHLLDSNNDAMMGLDDPMICAGYEDETTGLRF